MKTIILQRRSYLHMAPDWLIALSGIVGSVLTILISSIVKNATESDAAEIKDLTQFRADLVSRISRLEENQSRLQLQLDKWKGRYWRLYGYVATLCTQQGLPVPNFHDDNPPQNPTENED